LNLSSEASEIKTQIPFVILRKTSLLLVVCAGHILFSSLLNDGLMMALLATTTTYSSSPGYELLMRIFLNVDCAIFSLIVLIRL
jgi:hypothetical protein